MTKNVQIVVYECLSFQDNVAATWGQFVFRTWESSSGFKPKGLALIMYYSDQADQFIIDHWKRIVKKIKSHKPNPT